MGFGCLADGEASESGVDGLEVEGACGVDCEEVEGGGDDGAGFEGVEIRAGS